MGKRKNEINPGGINGTGKGFVDIKSRDFQGLREAIIEHAKSQTPQDRARYKLISPSKEH